MHEYGIRTIIDLRNDDEVTHLPLRPPGLPVVRRPLDAAQDKEFWDRWATAGQFGTPVYYRPFLDRFPQRIAGVLSAIAKAAPGGVLVHCAQGRDRTGLVSLILLAVAGVAAEDIAADYVMSTHRLTPLFGRLGRTDQGPAIEEYLARAGTSAQEIIISTLAGLDVSAYLRDAGLADGVLAELRSRLLDEPGISGRQPRRQA